MNVLSHSHAVIIALGYALLHFLWQGALVGAACALALRLTPRKYAQTRYTMSIAALAAMLALPIMTFSAYYDPMAAVANVKLLPGTAATAGGGAASTQIGLTTLMTLWLKPWLAWIVTAWLAGVGMLSLRTAIGWRRVQQYRRSARFDLPESWLAILDSLCHQLAIGRRVGLASSALIGSPSVIGWLKPLILIPPSALAGLTPKQIEMILAHELAHVRRYDYLVNLFQIVVETLLFYHPVVRWVSRQARQEREHCCDDLTVRTCGDACGYAHALAALEGTRSREAVWSLGIADGQLVGRIERLILAPSATPSNPWLTACLATALLLGFLTLRPTGESPHLMPPHITLPTRHLIETHAQTLRFAQPEVRQLVAIPLRAASLPDDKRTTAAHQEPGSAPSLHQSHNRQAPPAVKSELRVPVPSSEPHPAASDTHKQHRHIPSANSSAAQATHQDIHVTGKAERTIEPNHKPAVTRGPDTNRDAQPHRPAADRSAVTPTPRIAGGQPIHKTSPVYPRWSRERGHEGSATVEFILDTRGRARNIRVIKTKGGSAFGRAAADAIAQWRFRPVTRNGRPAQRKLMQQFVFQLKNTQRCTRVTGSRLCH